MWPFEKVLKPGQSDRYCLMLCPETASHLGSEARAMTYCSVVFGVNSSLVAVRGGVKTDCERGGK